MEMKEYVEINVQFKNLNKEIYEMLELTHSHIIILYYVYVSAEKKIDLSEIEAKMRTNTSILNRQIKELQKRDYITKHRYESNLRKVYLRMTDEQYLNVKALIDLIEEYLQTYK